MLKSLLLASLAFTFMIGCSSTPKGFNSGQLGDSGLKYKEFHQIYFAGQPNKEDLKTAKENEIKVVVNLRTAKEMKSLDFDEAKEAKKLGIKYYRIPFSSKSPIQEDLMTKIEATMMKHHKKGEKILIHCGSGQRAASWFAHHVFSHHKDNPDKAMKMAKGAGLSKSAWIKKTDAYLKSL